MTLNFSSAMRWHQQNTRGTSTKSCWSPSWLHCSWALACYSYYSGLGFMYEGKLKTCSSLLVAIFQSSRFVVVNFALSCPSFPAVSGDWLKRMKHSSGNKDITTQHKLDLIGLHWQYSGIIWTDFLFTSKGDLYNLWCVSLSLLPAMTAIIHESHRSYTVK